MDTKNLNIPALASAGVLLISVFLPWVTVSVMGFSNSANGLQDWTGMATIACAIGAGAMTFLGMRWAFPLAVGGVVMPALMLIRIFTTGSVMGIKPGIGFGLFIALAAGAALAFFTLPLWKDGETDFNAAMEKMKGGGDAE